MLTFFGMVTLIALARPLAVRLGYVDKPDKRKHHDEAVPLIGGPLIVSLLFIIPLCVDSGPLAHPAFLTALLVTGLLGILDDRFDLNAWVKLGLQTLIGVILVVGSGTTISNLGSFLFFDNATLAYFAVPFTILCVVLLMNAINMIDGLDGLSGGIVLTALIFLGLAAGSLHMERIANAFAIPAGILCGYLLYNAPWFCRPGKKIFMGDAGSLSLGLLLAWLAIYYGGANPAIEDRVLPSMSVAWILALPVVDAGALFIHRILHGRHPFHADRRHIHHHLLDAGYGPRTSTLTLWVVMAVYGAFGLYLSAAGKEMQTFASFLWVALVGLHIFAAWRHEWIVKRFHHN